MMTDTEQTILNINNIDNIPVFENNVNIVNNTPVYENNVNSTLFCKNSKVTTSQFYIAQSDEASNDFYCNFKAHQVSAYERRMHDDHSNKEYFIVNKDKDVIKVGKKFFDTHKKYVTKMVLQDQVRYYSSMDKDFSTAKLKNYRPQSIFDGVRSMWNTFTKGVHLMQHFKGLTGTQEMNAFLIDFSTILFDSMRLTNLPYLISLLLRIYSLILRFIEFRKSDPNYRQQSLGDIALFMTTLNLPRDLIEKIKIFQTLVTTRIMSSNIIVQVFKQFSELVFYFLDWIAIKFPDSEIRISIDTFVRKQFSFLIYMGIAEEVSNLYTKYVKNSQIIMDLNYRKSVMELESKISSVEYMEFVNYPECKHYKELTSAFKANILKYAKTYTVSSRIEPVCFIFEGPAGCNKSRMMNQLSEVFKKANKSVYTHIIPSVESCKDFYDDYENQDVFMVDDIGQQGLSQWRTIINFVAPVKLPLDCASAEKKNTKFFNSSIIVGTTNLLSAIQSFTAKDCISCKEALFRRIHLIKFENSIAASTKILKYMRFDQENDNVWKNQFLRDMGQCDLPTKMPVNFFDRKDNLKGLKWVYSLIEHAVAENIKFSQVTQLEDDELDFVLGNEDVFHDAQQQYQPQMLRVPEMEADVYNCTTESTITDDSIVNILLANIVRVSSNWWNNMHEFIVNHNHTIMASGLFLIVAGAVIYCLGPKLERYLQADDIVEKLYKIQSMQGVEELPSMEAGQIRNHIVAIKCTSKFGNNTSEQLAHGFISGNYIFVNDHLVGENPIFTISRSMMEMHNKQFLYNNLPYTVVKRYSMDDMCLLRTDKMPITPHKVYTPRSESTTRYDLRRGNSYVINPLFCIPIVNKINAHITDHIVKYTGKMCDYRFPVGDAITYPITVDGVCGSLLIDDLGRCVGHHVCGNDEHGVLKIWTKELFTDFADLHKRPDVSYGRNEYTLKTSSKENFSGASFYQTDLKPTRGSSKSSIIESDLDDVRSLVTNELNRLEEMKIIGPAVIKAPANLSAFGSKTLQTLSEKSYKPIPTVDHEEIEFAKECLETMMPKKFKKISLEATIFGDEEFKPLNKHSSNGYGYKIGKKSYIDFDNKTISQELLDKIEDFKDRCLRDELKPEDLLCKEALKDELRTLEKVNKPRTFRVLPLHHIILVKQLLGDLFLHLKNDMWTNGISVGMNPYLDFDTLHRLLSQHKIHFDGDFGSYDGSAPAQIQDMIAELVLEHFEGSAEDRKILKVLLDSMIRSWVLCREELYLTTHSMPSGCWVTALFNSLLNRALTAMCLKRNFSLATTMHFLAINDFVLGDDKIVSVPDSLGDYVNALTMKDLAESLGMTYTDALKGEITERSKKLEECQFLKRQFRFHRELGKIVGALDMNTLIESLRYFSSDKVYSEVMNGKMTALQFELFLYGSHAHGLRNKIFQIADERGIVFKKFSPKTIAKTMLEADTYEFIMTSLGKFVNY